MCADEILVVSYRLTPNLGIRSALPPRVGIGQKPRGGYRKVCPSIFACALLGGGWGLKTGGCGHPPLRGRWMGRTYVPAQLPDSRDPL